MNEVEKYVSKNENYIHDCSIPWRAAHLNPVLYREYKDYISGRVLDVGCNTGDSTYFLSKEVDEVVGIDVNAAALAVASDRMLFNGRKNVTFRTLSVTDLSPLKDDEFDGCYMLHMFEHILKEDVDKCLSEVRRVVKPNGHILLVVPRADPKDANTGQRAYDSHHKQFFIEEKDIREPLEKYFKIVHIKHDTRANPGRQHEHHNAWNCLLEVDK